MASKRRIAKLTHEVVEDLAQHGMAQVHVEIDTKKIAYVSGAVANQDDEADAVAVVLHHDVVQVQDGLERPGHVVPHLTRTGAIGPRSHRQEHDQTPAQRILGASHLEDRIFDRAIGESEIETGTPLTMHAKV